MLCLPLNFDTSNKYLLLLVLYCRLKAKGVYKDFLTLNYKMYVASDSELEYVTLIVDDCGTGCEGHAFCLLVTSNLSLLEAENQTWAAKELVKILWTGSDHIRI